MSDLNKTIARTTPIVSRGWCDLSTCSQGVVPLDCVRFGPVTVCDPCLMELSSGVDADKLAAMENIASEYQNQVDILEEKLAKARR